MALLFVLFYSDRLVREQKHLLLIPLLGLVCNDHFCNGELAGATSACPSSQPLILLIFF